MLRQEMKLLGIGDWSITVYAANSEREVAKVSQVESEQQIIIWVNMLMPPDLRVVRHELCHALLASCQKSYQVVVDKAVMDQAKEYARETLSNALERSTEMVRRAIDSVEKRSSK